MTKTGKNYRHEFKYIISEGMMAVLRNRVINILQPDPHALPEGSYLIRSVYFDDYANTCYYENENGTDPREKFRIRFYNCSDTRISLECKRKEREKTLKTSCFISRNETRLLMQGTPLTDIEGRPPILYKFINTMVQRMMKPVSIVEYRREPFVYSAGNVRVTFDTNIISSTDYEHLFDKNLISRSIMPVGFHLMEVKYDEYIPDFIYNCLQIDGLERTAFSKYYLSRKYNI
ncbi:MAG: polyphosphate polymerase domain-containing protein [Bacteroidales bacterium]|nr:polyphosphate polymerase domain-containing protein [Bacteroidales bacterium]